MRTIGLIGGMSWESTVPYYRLINEAIRDRLGGLHSARIILYSVDFHEVERLQVAGEWEELGKLLAQAARCLEVAGAGFLVLCTNTMHKVAPAIEGAVAIPLLHIVDAAAAEIKRAGLNNVGLLGTRFTMEQEFYIGRLQTHLQTHHGIGVKVPEAEDREIVHRVIYEELCLGRVVDASRAQYRRIIRQLADSGAEAIILGCTEIPMLVRPGDSPIPLFDTTAIHARGAAEWALSGPAQATL